MPGVAPASRRASKVKSLSELAAERAKCTCLRDGLDSLGHDGDIEGMAEADDRVHDRRPGTVGSETGDEARVDLDLVDRQRGDIGKR